jgi:hypothetical protein
MDQGASIPPGHLGATMLDKTFKHNFGVNPIITHDRFFILQTHHRQPGRIECECYADPVGLQGWLLGNDTGEVHMDVIQCCGMCVAEIV